MKVPSPTQGRTRPAGGALSYARPASNVNAGLNQLARSVGGLGEEVMKVDAEIKRRDAQLDNFNANRQFSEFQTNAAVALTDLKRGYRPDGKGYVAASTATYDKLEEQFIGNLPPDLQEQYRAQAGSVKQRVILDSFEFQYDQSDAWYRQGVSDQLNKSKTLVDQDPASYEAQRDTMFQTIDASDLTEAEKEKLKRETQVGLAAVQYKSRVRADATAIDSIGVGGPSAVDTVVSRIIGVESGGDPNAVPRDPDGRRRSSASGVGQFLDSTWVKTVRTYRPDIAEGKTDAELIDLKQDAGLGREMTTRLTEENARVLSRQGLPATATNIYLTHFAGQGGGPAILKASPDTPISEILSEDAIRANPEVLGGGATAGSVRAWAARKMREGSGIEADPNYASIPFEDRVALRQDAEREAAAAVNQNNALLKAQKDNMLNNLYLGLLDGKMGQTDIDNARAEGWLDDYENVNKAQGILKQRDDSVALESSALAKLQTPGAVWDPGNTNDKKMLNSLVGKNGLQKITSGDKDYVNDAIVPLVNQVGDIPTDVAGTLMGMVRSNNNVQAMFALDALAQLQDTNAYAFDQRVSSDIARSVDLWQARKDVTSQEELLGMVRGGTTQAERQARSVLRKEAEDILSRTENGVPVGKSLLEGVVSEFGGWFSSASAPAAPLAVQALNREFQTQFVDAYSKTGNVEDATELAKKELQRTWGTTSVGANAPVMKYPPEKVGYRQMGGSYDWINEQVRTEAGLTPQDNFQLFSDDQTRQEYQTFQRDASAQPPSYRIFTIDDSGVVREKLTEDGKPFRLFFKAPEAAVQLENRVYDFRAERKRLRDIVDGYERIREEAFYRGEEIPQEDTEAFNDALAKLNTLEDPRPKPQPLEPGPLEAGGMLFGPGGL